MGNMPYTRISIGNIKMGQVPSFSLPSGITCSAEACKTCYCEGCYGRKIERLRKTVRDAYMDNYLMATKYIGSLEKDLDAYFSRPNAPRIFRIHVSGDFFSEEYFQMWLRVITNHPNTKFMAFTKQALIIAPYLGKLPENLSLIWSAWPGVKNPEFIESVLPIAWMQDGNEERVPDDAIVCPGNCDSCGRCWAMDGHDVVFHKH